MRNKIYLVGYYSNFWEELDRCIVFATTNKDTAVKYQEKFDRIHKKWLDYYKDILNKMGEGNLYLEDNYYSV